MNQQDNWVELLARSPVLQAFVGAGVFVSLLLLTNDIRKRLFLDSDKRKSSDDDVSVTQELRLIRDEYRTLVRAQREYIEDLQEDITDHRAELRQIKTQPIPPSSDIKD